jgi:formate dehydrogenase maturation protein FdhE
MLKLANSQDLSNILEFASENQEAYEQWLSERSTINDMIEFAAANANAFAEYEYQAQEAANRRNLYNRGRK